MTETIALPDGQKAESPYITRRQADGAALRAIGEATSHLKDRALKIRQRHIQDCVDQILARVDPKPAAG